MKYFFSFSFPVITCANHFVSCGTSSKYKPSGSSNIFHHWFMMLALWISVLLTKMEKKNLLPNWRQWSSFPVIMHSGVFFTLLRKPQQSHFKMNSCFRIQIGNTYVVLKTLRFLLWESKFLLKFNCNWQFLTHSAFPWVPNLLLQPVSAMMHRELQFAFSPWIKKTYFHSPHWHRWLQCFPSFKHFLRWKTWRTSVQQKARFCGCVWVDDLAKDNRKEVVNSYL